MDAVYSLSADEGAILELLNGKESAEVTLIDLLQADSAALRRRLSAAEFQMSLMRGTESRLKDRITKLHSELSEYRVELGSAKGLCELLASELEAQSEQSPSVEGLVSIDELTIVKRDYEGLLSGLRDTVSQIENEKASLTKQLDEQLDTSQSLQERVFDLESQLQTSLNKQLAEEGRLSDLKLAHSRELREAQKERDSLHSKLESSNAENRRLEAKNSENKRRLLDAKNTLVKANQLRIDLTEALDKTRTERRYLGLMLESMIHEDFFKCDAGGASVFSFQTDITSTDGEFEIDPRYPIALWLGSNGFAVVMGISREDGNLIMPTIPGISDELLEQLCPPKSVQSELADKLKEFDVEACNTAMANTRHMISQMAVDLAHKENLLQSNKNLVAISCKHRAMARASASSQHGGKSNRKKRKK